MAVILCVTGAALDWCFPVFRCEVAALARNSSVKPNKWKLRQPVVKLDLRVPGFLVVTLFAGFALLAFMRIVLLVAGKTGRGDLLCEHPTFVATLAGYLGVSALQRKFGRRIVIERRRLPALRAVASLTLGPVAALVHVIGAMAGDAGHVDLFGCARRLVTRVALDFRVPPCKREMRLLVMVEADG